MGVSSLWSGRVRPRNFGLFAAAALFAASAACSSSSGSAPFAANSTEYTAPDGATGALESPGTCGGAVGGPVAGPPDDHCVAADGGRVVQPTTKAACTATSAPGSDDGGAGAGAGGGAADAGDVGNCGDPSYGPAMWNGSGSDDDCKYDVSWTSTPICIGQPVYFTVIATRRADGAPVTAANARPDVVLACDHPIPNSPAQRDPSPEVTGGTYVVGPIVFDESGKWVVRFHFDENCLDQSPQSPHGHAAFWVQVP